MRGAGRRAPPSAACEVASATFELRRVVERDRTEGERGCPAPRSPSSNATSSVLPHPANRPRPPYQAIAYDGMRPLTSPRGSAPARSTPRAASTRMQSTSPATQSSSTSIVWPRAPRASRTAAGMRPSTRSPPGVA